MTLIRTSPSGPNIEVDAPVDLGPNSVYGNPTAAPGPGIDISLGPNTVLGRVAGNIVAAQLVTAQIGLNQVTNAVLAQGAALTVKANPTGALADFQDVPATADDTVFRRVGGVLDFGPLTPGMLPPAIIPLSSIEPIAANTVVANATAGAASPTAVPIGTNTVLGRVAGNIVAAQVVSSQIGTAEVQNSNLGLMDAQTVKVNATGSPASPTDLVVGMNSVLGRVGGNIIAAQIVTAQIALNQVDNTILAKMAANTVKVNATGLLADPQDLTVGANAVLGRVAGNIVAAQVVTAQIAVNQVTNTVLAQMAALTVKANATNALADPQDLAASSNDTLLRRTGNTLNFGALTPGMIPSAIIPLSAIEQLAANTVVANATAGLASPTAVPLGFNTVLGRVAGNIVAAQVVTAQIALNQVTNAVLAQMAANTVKVNATAALADPQDLAVGTNTVLGRVAGNIVAAQLVDGQIANATISLPKLAAAAANTVVANATAGVASPTAVTVGTNTVLGRVAGNIVAAQVVTAQIAVNQVTNTVLAQMAALTVKANATNATADPQDLAAGSDDTVLRRTASTLSFGQLTAGMFPAAIIPLSSLATQAANTIVANATAGVASPTAVAVGTNTVVGRVAGNIVAAQVVTAQIALNQVTNAVLAQMAANTVKVNATAALADPQDLAVGTNTVLGRVAGNIVAAQVVNAQVTGGGLGTVKGVALGGVAGTLQDLTGAEQAQQLRFATVVTDTTSSGSQASYPVANTTTAILINTPTAVEILGITIPAVVGQRILFRRELASVAAWTFRNNNAGAGILQERLALNLGQDVLLDTQQCLELEYTNNRWRQIGSEASSFQAANTVFANATAASAAPTAVSIGTNTVLGRVAGNIVAAQIVTAQIALNQVTNAVLAQMAANTVKVNATAALADPQDLAVGTNTVLGRVAGNIVAAQVVTAQIAVNQVTNAVLAQMAANTVKVNATAALADPQDLAVGTNTVLGRVAGNIVAAQLVTAQIGTNQVTNAVLAQMAALTVKANATNATANAADLAAGSDDTILRRTASTLSFGQLTAGMFPAAIIPLSSLATQAANTIVANATAGVASPTAVAVGTNTVVGRVAGNIVAAQVVTAQIAVNQVTNAVLAQMAANTVKTNATAALADPQDLTVGTNTVLGRVAGNIVAAQVVTAQIAVNQVTNAVLAQMAANTVKVNATAALADPQDLTVGTNTVLGRVAGNIIAAQVVTAQIAVNQVTNAVLAQMAANTVKVNATAALADPQDLTVDANTVLGRVAGNIVSAQVVTAQIAVNQVTNAVLAQMGALTVKANATNATANAADLAAGSDDTVLRRTASTLSFGQLTAGMFPAAVIPLSSLATQAANTIVANATAGVASPTAVTVGTNTVVGRVAGNIVAAQLVTAQIAVNQVTNAVLAQMAANTVKVNATAALADPQDLAVGTNTVVGRVAGNIVAAQLINAQMVGGGLGTAKGVALGGVVGTLQDLTQAQQAENLLYATTVDVNPAAGNLDIAITTATTYVRIFPSANCTLRSLTTTAQGKEIRVLCTGSAFTVDVSNNDAGATLQRIFTPNGANVAFGSNASFTLFQESGGWRLRNQGVNVFTSTTPGLTPLSGGGTVNYLRADGAFTTVPVSSLTAVAANTVLANATAGVASPTAVAVGTNTVLGRVAGNIVAAQVVNAQITGGSTSTVKGVARGGVSGTLQDLTGTEIVEFLRWATVQVEVLTGTTNDLALGAGTTVLRLSSTTGPQTLTGITGGVAGRLLLIEDAGSSPNPITLASNTGSVAANQFRTPGGVNYQIGFRGNVWVEWSTSANDWRVVDRILPVSGLEGIASNTIIGNATAGLAQPTAISIGANTVLGRVAGNIVAAQAVNAQITGGALSTVKGVARGGVAGTLQDLTGTEIVEFLRWGTTQDLVLTTDINDDVALNAGTTILRVSTNDLLDSIHFINGLTGGVQGRLLLVLNVDYTLNQGISFANESASSTAANRFSDPGGVDFFTSAGDGFILVWDNTLSRWSPLERTVYLASMQIIGGGTLLGNSSSATGQPESISVGGFNVVKGDGAGGLTVGTISTANIGADQVTNALLANMAANTIKANATAGADNPTDVAVGTNTVVGRVAGNIVAAQLVDAQIATATISLPKLATVGANTVVANATAGSASPTAVSMATNTVLARDAGTISAFAIGTNSVLGRVAGNLVAAQLVDAQIATATISLPKLATQATNTIVANATSGSASPTAVSVALNTVVGRVAGDIVSAALVPNQLATEASSIAVTFSIRTAMTATGAAADDVVIYNANAPFAFRILKAFPVVTGLVAASTFVGRNATAGGGATVTSTFSGSVVSDDPAITANNGVSASIAAGGTLVIRRSSGNITGEVVLLCCRS